MSQMQILQIVFHYLKIILKYGYNHGYNYSFFKCMVICDHVSHCATCMVIIVIIITVISNTWLWNGYNRGSLTYMVI